MRELIIYGTYGSLVSNVGHVWYRYLNVVTGRTFRLGTYPGIGAKLAADCLLFNPIHVCCLLSYTHILKGNKIKVRLPSRCQGAVRAEVSVMPCPACLLYCRGAIDQVWVALGCIPSRAHAQDNRHRSIGSLPHHTTCLQVWQHVDCCNSLCSLMQSTLSSDLAARSCRSCLESSRSPSVR